jgi:hypothetical protein
MRTSRARLGVLAAIALALVATGCTSSGPSAPPSSAPAPTTPSTSTVAKAKPKPAKPKKHRKHTVAKVNPLTGVGGVPHAPLVAVKIDDTAPGRPQVGIDKADVVYIEAVEGGLTRLAAIYASHLPTVGYVRSTRPSDPDLLLQYGKITEAYSGGAHDSLPRVHRSGIRSWSNDDGARFYRRVPRAASSYINLALNLRKVNNTTKTPRPQKIGWTFSKQVSGKLKPKSGYHVSTEVTGSYAHGTAVNFKYSQKLHKYVRYIGGVKQRAADGKPIAATNVIVQACKVRSHPRDTDVLGNPSQFTTTVGKGPVVVFRGGHRIYGSWARGKLKDGTVLRGSHHMRIPLAPGNTWVVLIRKGVRVNGQRA